MQAYNDWMVEEWCAGVGRPAVAAVPDPAVGPAARGRRGAPQRGAWRARGVLLGAAAATSGCRRSTTADRHWDPFVAACAETGTVICMHSGSGSKMPSTSADAPPAVSSTLTHELAEGSLADWLFSGLLVRYPDVTLTYSEGQIGWIPYILARADRVWEHNRGWSDSRDLVPEPPSTYYWGRVYGCFFDDAAGLALDRRHRPRPGDVRDRLPARRRHLAPQPSAVAEKLLDGLDDGVVHDIVRGNALRMLGLDDAAD